jgi:LysR family nitrogen assimilation transcriptional regulator
MDLRQLRYFLTIAETGSISAASQRLNVAQPALSLHLRNMEAHLGAPLLLRGPRGVTPTEAGEMLVQRARLLLIDMARLEDDIRNLGRDPQGEVRLGLPGTIGGLLSPDLLLEARDRLPGVRLTISEAMSGFVLDWLREGRVDLAVLYLPANDPRFCSELLLQEELVVLVPPGQDHLMPDPLAALQSLPLIFPGPTHGLRQLLDAWADRRGIVLAPMMELDSYQNIMELVERGHGASILPLHAVAQKANEGRLGILRVESSDCARDVHLVGPAAETSSHACAAVMALVRGLMRRLVDDGRWAGARWRET